MDELDIARAIRDGELTSPQRYANLCLVALRITGTGAAYRSGPDEYVWRDPSIYLNDEFLERCQGLPVIVEHPKERVLDSEQFHDRVVGAIALPYVKGEEVWGIAKIYDAGVAELLETEQISTSPSVVLGTDNSKQQLASGRQLLIEGKPTLLDHLALVPLGTWDKGGPPRGVESARADSANPSDLETKVTSLAHCLDAFDEPDPRTLETMQREAGRYQALQQAFGDSANAAPPQRLYGESSLDFRVRLLSNLKKHSPRFKNSSISAIARDAAAFNQIAEMVYADAERAAFAPRGPLRAVTTREPSGHTMTRFYGDPLECWLPWMSGAVRFGRIVRGR